MDDTTILAAGACIVLAALVYLMWKSATADSWKELTQTEKKQWRTEEEERKGVSGAKGKDAKQAETVGGAA